MGKYIANIRNYENISSVKLDTQPARNAKYGMQHSEREKEDHKKYMLKKRLNYGHKVRELYIPSPKRSENLGQNRNVYGMKVRYESQE